MPDDTRLRELATDIALAVIERGRIASTGEPLFFDQHNLETVIHSVLVRTPVAPDGWQGLDRCESCPHHRVNHPGGPCVLCPCKQFAAAPREEPTASTTT